MDSWQKASTVAQPGPGDQRGWQGYKHQTRVILVVHIGSSTELGFLRCPMQVTFCARGGREKLRRRLLGVDVLTSVAQEGKVAS
jgi:hypothetical protein